MPGRRASWKSSNLRRSRGGGGGGGSSLSSSGIAKKGAMGNNGIANPGRGMGMDMDRHMDHIAVNQYAKALNPYKPSSSQPSAPRGVHGDSLTKDILEGDDILGSLHDLDDLDLSLSLDGDGGDDDDLGLENILSSIANNIDDEDREKGGALPAPSSGGSDKRPPNGFAHQPTGPPPMAMGGDSMVDEKKEMLDDAHPYPIRSGVSQVNFGDGHRELLANSFDRSTGPPPPMNTMGRDAIDEKKEMLDIAHPPPRRPSVSQANSGDDRSFGGESSHSIRRSGNDLIDEHDDDCAPPVSPVSAGVDNNNDNDNDNDTLWTDGDATKEHKRMLLRAGSQERPAFSSGGFDDAARMESMPMTGPSFRAHGAKSGGGGNDDVGSSLVGSIIDDISLSDSVPIRGPGASGALPSATTPGGGRHPSSSDCDGRPPHPSSSRLPRRPTDPLSSSRARMRDAPPQMQSERHGRQGSHHRGTTQGPPSRVVGGVTMTHVGACGAEAETLSTVTDPSESPVIYAYKKDDDSVSQITSSLAGNSGYGSLQNVPTSSFGSGGVGGGCGNSSRSRRIGSSDGLSWMGRRNSGTAMGGAGTRGGYANGRSRMIHRKPQVPSYGRAGSHLSSPGSASSPHSSSGNHGNGNGRNNGSRGSSSGSAGSVPSFEGGRSELDEIAYALNADCAPSAPGRRRRRLTPTFPVTREDASVALPFRNNNNNGREGNVASCRNEDLSTVESGSPYIETNAKSTVSRLGMGGVSCGAQSVSENTAVSESSSSGATRTLFQRLSMIAWRAQHHAGRFFFPTSPAVARRKKFDRSDSTDELVDILLEEGVSSSSSSHRKHRSQRVCGGVGGVRHGDDDYDDDEDVDYYSRAMSGPSNNCISNGSAAQAAGSRKPASKNRRRRYFFSTIRIGGLFFVLTSLFTVFRKPENENNVEALSSDRGRAGIGGRRYDPAQEERLQNLDHNQGGERDGDPAAREERKHDLEYQEERPQVFEYQEEKPQVFEYKEDAMMMVDDNYPNPNSMVNDNGAAPGRPKGNEFATPDLITPVAAELQPFDGDRAAVRLPSKFEALADVDDVLFQRGIEVPFFWHVPRSGGGTVNDVLGSCLHLTLAADAGGSGGDEETLKVLRFSHQVSYVNVDTSTHQGISRAKKLNLSSSGLADVVISPLLYEASTLFTPTRRGRLFTVFRHPIHRAASLFYFIQETQWQQPGTRNDQFADITIEKFYKQGFAENNWMTRFLTNELTKDKLSEGDLAVAKEVLRRKCLVGLLEEKGQTFERMQKYFGWRPKNEEERSCLKQKLESAWPMRHDHPVVEEGSRAWRLIGAANEFDLRLYEYAQELFAEQGEIRR